MSEGLLGISLAQQNDSHTATITFATEKHKSIAFKSGCKRRQKARKGPDIDDAFDGMTVLHSGVSDRDIDLEYALSLFPSI